ncbi:MAG: alpha-amylase/4-alpha-glucanotransferase domain-containing protein [Bacteroidota bacterium]
MLLAEQPKINLILGLHNHQPVGNWDWVIEDAYQHSYLPFIDCLAAHPGVRISIHYTGFLLEWLEEHHPEYIEKLDALISSGQLEILTGAHYEPILPVIPDRDKVGQIRRLTDTIERLFGKVPTGMWLAERVWEPHLVQSMVEGGVEYTILDDAHFKAVGLRKDRLFGYYQTEEQGQTLQIFPINKDLRALIPFAPPEKTIDYLRANASSDGGRMVLCFDDGEKFGCWPNTYQAVYLDGWLDRFFGLLEEHSDWIETVTVEQFREKRPPWGRVYLPSTSYLEMQEWALPSEQATLFEEALKKTDPRYVDFLRGGYWRNFLVKYPESNNLHKKMLRVSSMVESLMQARQPVPAGFGADPTREEAVLDAQEALWRGQSNDPYWHGVFGGLYLTNLRSANYQNLLEAEGICDSLLYDGPFLKLEERDFDCDGRPELLVSTPTQNCYFNLLGGSLFELDYKPKNFNLLDTIARRPEPYHGRIGEPPSEREIHRSLREVTPSKEAGFERMLHYDWYRRISLIDHFLNPDSFLESFYNVSYGEQGDFVNQPYECSVEEGEEGLVLHLHRDGHVWIGADFWPIRLAKRVTIPRDAAQLRVDYTIENGWDRPVSLWFGVEFNANFLAGSAPDRFYYSPDQTIEEPQLASKGELLDLNALGLRDEYLGIDYLLHWSEPATVWRFPIETISQSEAGFEKVYQSSVVMPNWKFELAPLGKRQFCINQSIVSL